MRGRTLSNTIARRVARGAVLLGTALALSNTLATGCGNQNDDSGMGTNPIGIGGMAGSETGTSGMGAPLAGMGAPAGAAGMDGTGTAGIGGGMAGTNGMAGTGAMAGMGAMAGTGGEMMPREDLGMGDGNDVITIGDSYMLLIFTGIQVSLERISGRNYRNFAVPGTRVLNEQIPGQYADAKAMDPDIKTVIMTGGGNDILFTNCSGADCNPIVDMVGERLNRLRDEMAADGVEDIVIVSYGYPADMTRHAALDYSRMMLAEQCTKDSMPRCHFIDPVEELEGEISADGIHPTDRGYDILGQMVWDLMQAEGMRR